MASGVSESFFLGHDADSIGDKLRWRNQTTRVYENWHLPPSQKSLTSTEPVVWIDFHYYPIGSWVLKNGTRQSSVICQIAV